MRKYENELPANYTEAAHIVFENVRTGFINDFKVVLPGIIAALISGVATKPSVGQFLLSILIFAICVYPYFVLHEIVHGVVYQKMTGQHIKIGFRRGGAYCGMPDVLTYRYVFIRCTAAPLIMFTLLYSVGIVLLVLAGNWVSVPFSFLLTFHLFGCRSDINLLRELAKHRDPTLLVRDTGMEQWFYAVQQ